VASLRALFPGEVMRLFYALAEFIAEQRDCMKLASAVAMCELKGHEPTQTIMFRGDLVACCPRCGHES